MYEAARLLSPAMTRRSIQNSGAEMLQITEIDNTGTTHYRSLTKDEFVDSIKEHHLPLRDLRMLVKSGDSWRTKHPSLCPRPASKCFIFEIEHIKLLCFRKRSDVLTTF